MRQVIGVLTCALLALAWPAAAQVYKWTDENGKVHYGDKPQGAKAATTIATPATGTQQQAAVNARNARQQREALRRY